MKATVEETVAKFVEEFPRFASWGAMRRPQVWAARWKCLITEPLSWYQESDDSSQRTHEILCDCEDPNAAIDIIASMARLQQ